MGLEGGGGGWRVGASFIYIFMNHERVSEVLYTKIYTWSIRTYTQKHACSQHQQHEVRTSLSYTFISIQRAD